MGSLSVVVISKRGDQEGGGVSDLVAMSVTRFSGTVPFWTACVRLSPHEPP